MVIDEGFHLIGIVMQVLSCDGTLIHSSDYASCGNAIAVATEEEDFHELLKAEPAKT
jgi:hypothetical protein